MSAQGLGALVTALFLALKGKRLKNPGILLIGAAMLQAIGSVWWSYTDTFILGFIAVTMLGLVSMVFGILTLC